jgi:hypothetical protein
LLKAADGSRVGWLADSIYLTSIAQGMMAEAAEIEKWGVTPD